MTVPAAAQRRAEPVVVESCPAADSLLGPLADNLGAVMGMVADSPGVTVVMVGPKPGTRFAPNARGILHIGASTSFVGKRPAMMPPVAFDLQVIDEVERTIEGRQLSLIFDAADTTVIGSMQSRVQDWPGRADVVQNMAAALPAAALRRASLSRELTVLLGDTWFKVPRAMLRDLRALYVASLCGVSGETPD